MTTHATPSATAAEASAARRLSARSSPSVPSETAYVASSTRLVQPRWSIALSASICSTVSRGDLSRSLCASVSLVVTRSPSGPTMHSNDVTTASRMGSMGGFVTCANICLKYSKVSLGISDITASGASLPIEPSASLPVPIMGSRIMSSASRVNPAARSGRERAHDARSLVEPLIAGIASGFAFAADLTISSRSITWFFTQSGVRALGRDLRLHVRVLQDRALLEVHQQDVARAQAPLLRDVRVVDVHDANLGGHDDAPGLGQVERPGRSPLRSSVAPTWFPSVNVTSAGPSQGSILAEWNS